MTDFFQEARNSKMDFDRVYFWTDTVKDWIPIFKQDEYKMIVISTMEELVNRGVVIIYGFVVMPNHLHMIWEMKELNGKESPVASFNKFTSHLLAKKIKAAFPILAEKFKVTEVDRKFRIWQRDPLSIEMDTILKIEQKLNYIHQNPLQAHWNLASEPEDYFWSSARFYESGENQFGFLTDYRERF
jgi:putative transposase